ncbi:EF-hand domain-containing protein [Paludisphaera rhizosphaerae]|uniref:hypothetical protein n=1 Tax=Paludisphaera rhizosphaerae TaxID=2711216 RepID=UPI0013EB95D5|nr:hypothetical protein [Paludisphaera rhizosphaerae]
MKLRALLRALTFAAFLSLLASAAAFAQRPAGPRFGGGPPDGPPGGGRMDEQRSPLAEALDLNGDGVLSAEEIRKASESLQTLDRDGDGRIDRSELRPAADAGSGRGGPRMGAGRRGPGGPGGPGFGGPRGPGGEGVGPGPGGPEPRLGDVLPPFVRQDVRLTPDQEMKLQALGADVRTRLGSILTRDQIAQCEESMRRGPEGGGGAPGGEGPPRGPQGRRSRGDDETIPQRPRRPE